MKRFFATAAAILVLGAPVAEAFTTAAQVKPILNATKANWIAVREYDGNDLLYFTHIESWRCGLSGVRYGINKEEADTDREMEPCYEGEPAPNAFKLEGHLPFITLPLGSVEKVTIELLYDDGSTDTVTFERAKVLMP